MLKRIGFDYDEVCVDIMGPLLSFHNERYKTSFKREDFHTFELASVVGCTPEEVNKRIEEFYESKYFKEIKPIPGASECMDYLQNIGNNERFVITARPSTIKQATKNHVKSHFPGKFQGVYFAHHGSNAKTSRKSYYCNLFKLDCMVEDDINHVNDINLRSKNTIILVPTTPWNVRVHLPYNAIRVSGWKEIESYFKSN